MNLQLQKRQQSDRTAINSRVSMMTLDTQDYWSYRVQVSKTQAIIGFPKFFTIGIGFEKEKDWNTNLPFTSNAEDILKHIWFNRGNDGSQRFRAKCLEAIRMIQYAIKSDPHREE